MKAIINQINACVSDNNQKSLLIEFIENSKKGLKSPKLMVFYGGGGNGKSTLINLLSDHFGTDSVHVPNYIFDIKPADLHNTNGNRYMYLSMDNKKLGFISELYDDQSLNNQDLKSLTKYLHWNYPNLPSINNTANYILQTNTLDLINELNPELYTLIHFDTNFYELKMASRQKQISDKDTPALFGLIN